MTWSISFDNKTVPLDCCIKELRHPLNKNTFDIALLAKQFIISFFPADFCHGDMTRMSFLDTDFHFLIVLIYKVSIFHFMHIDIRCVT